MRLGLLQCMLSPMGGIFTEYSADIHKLVIGYSYVSGMCRVCIAYVSESTAKVQHFFHICKYHTRSGTKKSPLMQNINGEVSLNPFVFGIKSSD